MENNNIKHESLKGKRYGKLTVISYYGKNKWGSRLYRCKCDCGNETMVNISHLRAGSTSSCGCLRSESRKGKPLSHGMTSSRLYYIWDNMIQRCTNEKNKYYHNYGGRGIKVCDRWRDSFEVFYNDVSESYYQHLEKYGESNTTINRIDVNGDYEPNNVNWATRKIQSYYQRTPKTNRSGYKGINYRKDRKKWRAFIGVDGKQKHLGSFDKKEDAIKARQEAEIKMFGELLPR